MFLLTLLLYGPSYQAGYIWDDDIMVEKNPLVNGGWAGLRDIWTTTQYPDFVPWTATSFWLETQLGGTTATARHTTNIVLQGLNVVWVWLVLRRLKIPGAWIAAAIFAAHPLTVTSVTWVAERKNTLSLFFYLLSFWFYQRSEPTPKAKATSHLAQETYWLAFFFYLLALLSKTSTVILPVVFLLCAWWKEGRLARSAIWPTLPFFGIALAGGVTTLIAHYFFGDKTIPYDDSFSRLLTGAKAVWFYLSKAFLPVNLMMHYPRWDMDARSFASYLPGLGLVGGLAGCWHFRRTWGQACLFGLGYFLLALAPALGVAKMTFLRFAQVADHFQFLALPGLIAWVVGGACHLAAAKRALHFCQALFLAIILPVLAALSWQHQRIIGDAETMWRDNLKKNPQSWLSHYGLTSILQARGELGEVEKHYRQAIAIRPHYLDALSNLGVLLAAQNRWEEAMDCYRRALAFAPTAAVIHFNLGTALMAQNRYLEAVGPLTQAVTLHPQQSNFRNNLASVLLKMNRPDEAFQHARTAIRLNPENDEAQANLGLMLFQNGKTSEAIAQFQTALRRNPANVSAHYRCATILASMGQDDNALVHLRTVVQLQPDHILARTGLAEILKRLGQPTKATSHQAALSFLRGREFVNKRQFDEAKANFRQAVQLDSAGTMALAKRVCTASTPNALSHFDLLAAICAEEGQAANALAALQQVIALAETLGQGEVAAKYRKNLEEYRQKRIHP